MGKDITKKHCIDSAYASIRRVPKKVMSEYQKQFFLGASKGFELVDFIDKKYEEIINDFSNLFRRR
jgi:hypothetical protein